MSRYTAREEAFKMLFELNDKNEACEVLDYFYENNDITVSDRHYIDDIVLGTIKNKEKIDSLIKPQLKGFEISRISRVSKALIRLALFEILERDDIPPTVSINEAVELSKKYDDLESTSFVNAVLDKIVKGMS